MQHQLSQRAWKWLVFALLAVVATWNGGCSASPVLDSSPVARTLRLPAHWRASAKERELRRAVEADRFPRANEHGL